MAKYRRSRVRVPGTLLRCVAGVLAGIILVAIPVHYWYVTKNTTENPTKTKFVLRRSSGAKDRKIAIENRVKEKERKYYILGENKINHIDYNFIINGKDICNGVAPFLVILVPSLYHGNTTRMTIRNTWGQFAKSKKWPKYIVEDKASLVFLLGKSKNYDNSEKESLQHEAGMYGDIVYTDFIDSYENLTVKSLMGLKWVSTHCKEAKFILKVDQDVFVSIPELLPYLKHFGAGANGTVFGRIYRQSRVQRKKGEHWFLSYEDFPFQKFPVYASGNSYVLSGDLAPKSIHAAQYMKYIPLEDVFITGILARVLNARHIDIPGAAEWAERSPVPCDFVGNYKFSATNVDEKLMTEIWETLSADNSTCDERSNLSLEALTDPDISIEKKSKRD